MIWRVHKAIFIFAQSYEDFHVKKHEIVSAEDFNRDSPCMKVSAVIHFSLVYCFPHSRSQSSRVFRVDCHVPERVFGTLRYVHSISLPSLTSRISILLFGIQPSAQQIMLSSRKIILQVLIRDRHGGAATTRFKSLTRRRHMQSADPTNVTLLEPTHLLLYHNDLSAFDRLSSLSLYADAVSSRTRSDMRMTVFEDKLSWRRQPALGPSAVKSIAARLPQRVLNGHQMARWQLCILDDKLPE